MKIEKLAGATSEIWQIFVQDSSSLTGAGLAGLAFGTSGLTAYYHRDTDTTATAIALVTMTVGSFTSSGFKEIDATNMPGWYQFCPPNAAIASGAKSCGFHLKGAANMAPLPIEVQLVSNYNPDAALQAFPTNFSTLAIDANGNVTPITADQGTAQAGAAGTVTLRSGASATNDLYKGAIVAIVSGTGVGQARTIAGYVGSTKVASVDWNWTTAPDNTSVYRVFFENQSALNSSLQVATTASDPWATSLPGSYTAGQAGYIIGNGFQLVRQNTAQAGAAATITLDASASATDNLYQHLVAFIISGTGAGQARQILGYVGSTKVASVFPNWVVNPDSSSVFRLVAFAADNLGFDFTGITEANFPKAGPYAAHLPSVGDSQDDGAGHLIIKRTTGTEHYRRTLTTDGTALPIKGEGAAS